MLLLTKCLAIFGLFVITFFICTVIGDYAGNKNNFMVSVWLITTIVIVSVFIAFTRLIIEL